MVQLAFYKCGSEYNIVCTCMQYITPYTQQALAIKEIIVSVNHRENTVLNLILRMEKK